jgi:hypothetical protein
MKGVVENKIKITTEIVTAAAVVIAAEQVTLITAATEIIGFKCFEGRRGQWGGGWR